MIRKITYGFCLILLVFYLILAQNLTPKYEYKVLTIRSIYNYIYDINREYSLNIYLDSHLKDEVFRYYLAYDEEKILLNVSNTIDLREEDIFNKTYTLRSIYFLLDKPLSSLSETYLIIENNNYSYRLDIGLFYTYYSRDINYFSYYKLDSNYNDSDLKDIIIETKEIINNVSTTPLINTTISEYSNDRYIISLDYNNYYLYKTYLKIYSNNEVYILDCPRFKVVMPDLNQNLKYLSEGVSNA